MEETRGDWGLGAGVKWGEIGWVAMFWSYVVEVIKLLMVRRSFYQGGDW
jgi:hypothetical protein